MSALPPTAGQSFLVRKEPRLAAEGVRHTRRRKWQQTRRLSGPDLAAGVSVGELSDGGKILGHAHGEEILLVRTGDEIFAISPHCTHYHGPLAEGLVVGRTVRCPWHHACFDLQTGEALKAPAIDSIQSWNLEQRDGTIAVTTKRSRPKSISHHTGDDTPQNIVIVGGGAAGFAAAEMLRRKGYQGSLIMLSSDSALPYDRPNLSKDYLAGTAPFEYVPLKDERFYAENNIETRLGERFSRSTSALARSSSRAVKEFRTIGFSWPRGRNRSASQLPGADLPHVHTLRSLADCQSIIEGAKASRRAVVIGASFIGLEVAASLRARG